MTREEKETILTPFKNTFYLDIPWPKKRGQRNL
jgi:hypothetical protein